MEKSQNPPTEYEDLIRSIHDRHEDMSKTYKMIAVYLTQNPNDVAVHSVNSLAKRCAAVGLQRRALARRTHSVGRRAVEAQRPFAGAVAARTAERQAP